MWIASSVDAEVAAWMYIEHWLQNATSSGFRSRGAGGWICTYLHIPEPIACKSSVPDGPENLAGDNIRIGTKPDDLKAVAADFA